MEDHTNMPVGGGGGVYAWDPIRTTPVHGRGDDVTVIRHAASLRGPLVKKLSPAHAQRLFTSVR